MTWTRKHKPMFLTALLWHICLCCHNQRNRQESWGKVKHFFPALWCKGCYWEYVRALQKTEHNKVNRVLETDAQFDCRRTWNNSNLTRHKYSQFDPKNMHLRFLSLLICYSWVMYDAPRLETLSKCLAKIDFFPTPAVQGLLNSLEISQPLFSKDHTEFALWPVGH